jgi:hypothetical protein
MGARKGALMPDQRPLLVAATLAGSLLTVACAGGASPVTPTTISSPAVASAPLVVQVDTVCMGRESEIRVYVDGVQIGVTNPGESGVSRDVPVGEHKLSAVSRRGTQWGPFPTLVTSAGRMERLGCMPADAL